MVEKNNKYLRTRIRLMRNTFYEKYIIHFSFQNLMTCNLTNNWVSRSNECSASNKNCRMLSTRAKTCC